MVEAEDADEVIEGEAEELPSEDLILHEKTIATERASTPAPASVLPSPLEWEASIAVAEKIAGTQFVPESYRGRPDAVVAAILTGREMGIGPMQSLRQIHMIDGRPTFAADLMLAKMRQGGIQILTSKVTDEGAWITAKRKDTGEECEVEFTVEHAQAAGLIGKRNWQNYREDMFWARAVGRLARRLGSDLLGGLVYTKEELEDVEDGGYGGGGHYDTQKKPFDPETDLMDGAIPGSKDAPKAISEQLGSFDPTVDWGATISALVEVKWGVASRTDLKGEQVSDFWRRLSNAARYIETETPSGDFPPVEAEVIERALAWAFSGAKVEVVYKDATAKPELPADEKAGAPQTELISAEEGAAIDAIEDDIPFGEEKKDA